MLHHNLRWCCLLQKLIGRLGSSDLLYVRENRRVSSLSGEMEQSNAMVLRNRKSVGATDCDNDGNKHRAEEASGVNGGSSQDNKVNPYEDVQNQLNGLCNSQDGSTMDVDENFEDDTPIEPESNQPSGSSKESSVSNQSNNTSEITKNECLYFVLSLLPVGLLLVACLGMFQDYGPELSKFDRRLEALKSQFRSQTPTFWNAIKMLGKQHISECVNSSLPGPYRPLIFLLLRTSDNSEDLVLCLSKKIAELFGEDVRYDVLDGNEIAKKSLSKAELDNDIMNRLSSTTEPLMNVLIFTELDSLSYETASIFFKYCDNDNAPYPRSIFIFTLTLDENVSFLQRSTRKEITAKARDYLGTVAWKDEDRAKTDALIARLFNPYPLPIMKESSVPREVCG